MLRMSKRIVVLMVALTLAVAPFASAQTSKNGEAKASETKSEKAPRLTILEPIKDFGVVAKGDKLDWSFVVKNTGDADLEIIAAKPGCGCTVADFDKIIKPGQTGKVNAHVDTTNFTGPIAKTIELETNDPSVPSSQLTIDAVVKPYVDAYPAGFVRFNLLKGEAATQSIVLYSEEQEPFDIVKIELPMVTGSDGLPKPVDWMKVNYAKITDPAQFAPNVGRSGQSQYKLGITVGGPDARIGALADKIRVVTTSKHQPDYLVSVTGVIRPTLRVDPTGGINFGEVSPADPAATRVIILHSNNLRTPEAFNVTRAESSIPGVLTSIHPTTTRGEYEVTLQVSKDAKVGDIDGNVKIYTNDQITPVVTVPVRGTIKRAVTGSASK
jgi:Protein of unknown function (DUF1573)